MASAEKADLSYAKFMPVPGRSKEATKPLIQSTNLCQEISGPGIVVETLGVYRPFRPEEYAKTTTRLPRPSEVTAYWNLWKDHKEPLDDCEDHLRVEIGSCMIDTKTCHSRHIEQLNVSHYTERVRELVKKEMETEGWLVLARESRIVNLNRTVYSWQLIEKT